MTLDFYGHRDNELGRAVRYSVTNLATAQARGGDHVEIHLLSTGSAKRVDFENVTAYFHRCVEPPRALDTRFRFGRQISWSMLCASVRADLQVVHFHGPRQFHIMYGLTARRATQMEVPIVAQERGFRHVGAVERWFQAYGLRHTDAILAASREGLDALGAFESPAVVRKILPNGFDPSVFHSRGRMDPLRGSLRVLYVSRLAPEKAPMRMVEAVGFATNQLGVDLQLTVVGRGPLVAAVEEGLKAHSVSYSLVDQVPQAELADLYRASDVVIVTSKYGEGWNQVALEAMASGTPVIAEDVAGLRDVVGTAGVVVAPGDPAAIGVVLARLAHDLDWRRELIGATHARACRFTWDDVAAEARDTYERILSVRGLRTR